MKMSIYPAVKKLTENDLFEMVKNGLQRELEGLRLYRKELERNQKLYDENQRLREALEFYADEENYEITLERPVNGELRAGPSWVEYDNGEKARQALGWDD